MKTDEKIPMKLWSRDHWSTLAYIETRCVDHGGVPNREHMRTNDEIHPGLSNSLCGVRDPEKYPTILVDGSKVSDHDDWSCVDDFIEEGLMEWQGTGINPIFVLTKESRRVCNLIREHKQNGGTFGTFSSCDFEL